MAKTIRFRVTKEDIRDGKRFNPCRCPIALAIGRRFPEETIFVNHEGVQFSGTGNIFNMPQNAQTFITYFDSLIPVSPFEFDAELI